MSRIRHVNGEDGVAEEEEEREFPSYASQSALLLRLQACMYVRPVLDDKLVPQTRFCSYALPPYLPPDKPSIPGNARFYKTYD